MTNRIVSLTVILDREYRDDDAARIVDAIQMTKGVLTVEQGPVVDVSHYFNKEQIVRAIREKMLVMLDPKTLKLDEG